MAPPMLGLAGLGSTIFGGALQAGGNLFKGASEMQMYNYQAGVAEINARIARQNMEFAYRQGDRQLEKYGIKAGQQMGQIRAAQASSGLDINSGSNLQVQQSQQQVIQSDMATMRQNIAKTAYDYQTQAVQYENQASLYKTAGRNSMIAGVVGGISSIVGTAGSVADKWLQGSQVGLDREMKTSLGA